MPWRRHTFFLELPTVAGRGLICYGHLCTALG